MPLDKQGPNDDPDNDGIPNLMEYAIAGQDPTLANPTVGSFTGTTLSFIKRPGTSGLTTPSRIPPTLASPMPPA